MDSCSSSSSRPWRYDVFLSFRGEDTRKKFTDHLYHALKDAGINVFRDDNELRRGEDIATELVHAIQRSRISVIVFSKNYADSRWCLEELVEILRCRQSVRQLVFPVYYDVDPADVREQTGSFGEAFVRHEERFMETEMDKVLRWRLALTEAADLSGWDLRNAADGHEGKFIKKIAEEILRELKHTYLFVALYPVGIESRVKDMNLLLGVGVWDVRMVGIWGMGGIGKTTIAKALFNQYFHGFEGKSFLANVREMSKEPDGLVRLQEQLLSDILKIKKIRISCVDRGISIIRERLRGRRVLIILDDVDQLEQLNAIARERAWFGDGSRVIITTRDEHVLRQLKVDKIYKAKELTDNESLELFSWHAFHSRYPVEDYVENSKSVASFCGGLPLALEVLGSFLFGRTIPVWKSALERLKRIPHDQIQEKLRLSFDGLGDDNDKDIFLDVSCFFTGMEKDYVVQILDGCGYFAEIAISLLVQRCLVTIGSYNKLTMHDLLRDMGREIVRAQSPKEPGKSSRLWLHKDVVDVLTKQTGTGTVEGLILKLPRSNHMILSTTAFSKMDKLRLLQLNYANVLGGYEHLSKELRWLCWHGFPLKYIPDDFCQENLVALDMRYSNLKQVWKNSKVLENLKFLNLSHSQYLRQSPDFTKLPNLEKLILKNCSSLIDVHQSIGHLDRLILVNFKDCKHLKNLPRSFYRLKSLETLILSGCLNIHKLDEDLGDMQSLTKLIADNTGIRQIPFTIVRLKNLKDLSLCGSKGSPPDTLPSLFLSWVSLRKNPDSIHLLPASVQGLNSLRRLCLADCNLSDDMIPKDLGRLFSLYELDLQRNRFQSLPTSIACLSKLQSLLLDHCTSLQSIPELPTSLNSLYATNCSSLQRMPNISDFSAMQTLNLSKCHKLVDIPGLDRLKSMVVMHMEECINFTNSFKEKILQGWSEAQISFGGIYLPGNDIPDWFDFTDEGPSVCLEVPRTVGCKLKGFIVCILYSCQPNEVISEDIPSLTLINYTKEISLTRRPITYDQVISSYDHLWKGQFQPIHFNHQLDDEDEVEFFVDFGSGFTVKKTGVHFVYEETETYSEVNNETLMEYTSISAGTCDDESKGDAASINVQRVPDDAEAAGPSLDLPDNAQCPKRLKYQSLFATD